MCLFYISETLLANFKEANRQSARLADDYEMLDWTESSSGSRSIHAFFIETERVKPNVRAAITFSNVAVDVVKGEGLVYAEYYSRTRGTLRLYLLLKLDNNSTDPKKPIIAGVTISKVYSVFPE